MVKLRFDKSKRRYKNGKIIYANDRIPLVFPREYHELLKSLQGKDLAIHVTRNGENVTILLLEDQFSNSASSRKII
jgi:hypothetical protein